MDDVTLDERRGIQGAKRRGPEERLESARSSQTVQGRYLGGREGLVRAKEQEQEEELEQERILEEEELEEEENFALDEEARERAAFEANQAIQRANHNSLLVQRQINIQKEKARMMLLSKIKKTKRLLKKLL